MWGLAGAALIIVWLLLVLTIFIGPIASPVMGPAALGSGIGVLAPIRKGDYVLWLWLAVLTPLAIYIGFFVGALFVYRVCRVVGGVGRTGLFASDFKVHAYLLSLVAVPVSVLSSAVSLIPNAGSYASSGIIIYSFFLQYLAIRASMQLSRSKAQRVIMIEIVAAVVLATVGALAAVVVYLWPVIGQILGGPR